MKIVKTTREKCRFCKKEEIVNWNDEGWGSSKHKCKEGKKAFETNNQLLTKLIKGKGK